MPTRSVNSRRDVPDDPLADGQREEGPRTELLERLDQMQQKIDAATEALAARQAELEARDAEMALREQVIAARLASVERTIPDLSGRQDLQGNDATQRTSDRGVDDQTNLHVPNETSSEEDVPEAKPVELESDMSEFKMLAKALATRLTAGSEERPAEVVSFKDPPARAPDRFDGTNRAKLRPFLTQLNIVFLHHARRFSNDQAKVLYAGSYLGGVAADWFEPILDETNLQSHRLLKDWNLFRDSLTAVFGDMNAEGTAEHELNNIKMDDRDEISTYLTQFRTYQTRLNWDNSSLMYHFKLGLPERLIEDLKHHRKPATLSALQELALELDNAYWEAERDKRLRRRRQGTNVDLPGPRRHFERQVDKVEFRVKPAFGSTRVMKPVVKFQPKPAFIPRGNNAPPKKDLDRLLDNKGRLTPSERARRIEKGLCAYCGGPHKIDHCPNKPQQSNARAVNTDSRRSLN